MLQELVDKLSIPGMPPWVGVVLLIAIAISILAFLAMPFSVFGVKSRLEAIEAELADLRNDLRTMLRQGPTLAGTRATVEDDYVAPPRAATPRAADFEPRVSPPVPPPPARPSRAGRAEPRLDWPRTDKGE